MYAFYVLTDTLSRNTKLMIANAMYFKGKWRNAFDFDKTSVKCFYVEVNQCLDTYFMEIVNVYYYAYISNLHAHAVELPYEVSILKHHKRPCITHKVLDQI